MARGSRSFIRNTLIVDVLTSLVLLHHALTNEWPSDYLLSADGELLLWFEEPQVFMWSLAGLALVALACDVVGLAAQKAGRMARGVLAIAVLLILIRVLFADGQPEPVILAGVYHLVLIYACFEDE